MHVPVLETDRLRLIPPDTGCEDTYQRFYTDAQASAAYGGPLTEAAAHSRLASDIDAWHRQGFGVWAIQRKTQGDVVGVCGFWQGKEWPRELTWWLLPEVRGAGLAYEASVAAIAHAYGEFGWETVQTYMNDANAPARSLALKLGGQMIGRQLFPDGLERDVYWLPRRNSTI
jgi:[ribosomal protein S5]-alanine N-acetyltransferase